uniref:Reverse transcriptase Ty1/copia-type domain-containing protein n=1 Tax=Fagus sylvatica TaxID=28930 RepID=A0A2N9GHA6_FAGSY
MLFIGNIHGLLFLHVLIKTLLGAAGFIRSNATLMAPSLGTKLASSRKGCHQQAGVDFDETFSPVVKPPTVPYHLVIGCSESMDSPATCCNNPTAVSDIITQLSTAFELKDLGPLRYFLGLQIEYKKVGLFVHQHKYLTDFLHKFHMTECKAATTPIAPTPSLSTTTTDLLSDPTPYRSLVGALQYATFTRPDIAFAVNRVCQFMHQPSTLHFAAAKRILRYLKGTLDKGVLFQAGPLALTAFTDADWAGDASDRRSTSGIVVFLGNNPITWLSKKQHTVSRSSTEAEYRSLPLVLLSLPSFAKFSMISGCICPLPP